MKKKISILLIATVLVNVLSFGFLDVKSSAVLGLDDVLAGATLGLINSAIGNAAAGSSAYILNNNINSTGSSDLGFDLHGFTSYHGSKRNVSTVSMDEVTAYTDGLLVYSVQGSTAVFSVDPAAPADQVEFANLLASKLNALPTEALTVSEDGTIKASQYETIVNTATNTTLNYLNAKRLFATGDAFANSGANPYDFSFTGPVLSPDIPMPTSSGFVSNTIGGFTLSRPYMQTCTDGNFLSREEAEMAGATMVAQWGTNSYGAFVNCPGYGCGNYVIYNGEIYYNVQRGANAANSGNMSMNISDQIIGYFYNSKGENLAQKGCTTTVGLLCGYYYGNQPNSTTNIPINVTQEDLTETIGGGDLTIAAPVGSAVISSAIGAGILTPDSKLKVDENGNIIGADGISLAQIETLLNKIANKNVDFSSITGYLAAIQAATEGTNLSAGQIATVLSNVQNAVNSNSTSLSTINTTIAGVKDLEEAQQAELEAINANTKIIADAITATQEIKAEKKFDIKTPSNITDKFPFSLPFDVYNTFNLLSAEPVAPKFTIPLKMDGVFEYEIEVDLSEYDWLANIVRWFIFIAFVVGLILITNKLIGRG